MTKAQEAKQAVAETVHTPTTDDSGALRADRPFTPEEAVALDTANREAYEKVRRERFVTRGGRRR